MRGAYCMSTEYCFGRSSDISYYTLTKNKVFVKIFLTDIATCLENSKLSNFAITLVSILSTINIFYVTIIIEKTTFRMRFRRMPIYDGAEHFTPILRRSRLRRRVCSGGDQVDLQLLLFAQFKSYMKYFKIWRGQLQWFSHGDECCTQLSKCLFFPKYFPTAIWRSRVNRIMIQYIMQM